ncbi:MAG: acyl--CoA ligase [Actinomycetota bacterium]|nr:acyl--CoA ligase [Actinomycetota bacterium]
MPPDLANVVATVKAELTGPGGEFELAPQDVRGVRLPVFVNRRRSLRSWLADSAAFSERECVVQDDRRLTFAQHQAAVAALADALAADHGVGPGDRVAILAANSPDWLVAFWAATTLGAVVVAGNAWWTAREAVNALSRFGASVIVADGRRAALLDDLGVPILRIADVPALVATRSAATLPDVRIDEDDAALVMFTSGTSGRPKGAVHSHRSLLSVIEYHRLSDAVVAAMNSALGAPPRTAARRFLMSLPLFHIASLHNLALPRLATGDTVVIDEGRFDVDRVLRLVERERITNWAVVPTMAHRIVAHGPLEDYDLSTLVGLSINSAPSSPALKDRVRSAVPTVQASLADSYGLTEICTAATVASAVDLAAYPDSVGMPIASVELRVCDADGAVLPDGEAGEIQLRSQFTMTGYWDDPQATADAIDPDGWFRTGDLGHVVDGRLFIAARRTDLILRGGENVYPAEIEAVLDEYPGVQECAVLGVEHPELGQEVAAVIVPTAGATVTEEDLRAFAAEQLAYFKVPSRWRFTEEPLRRNATGKIIRTVITATEGEQR